MKRRPRGAALVAALLLSVVLFLVGIGFLGQRRGQYEAAREFHNECRANALAEAGLQDALGKLAKDYTFPPLRSDDQADFVYSEELQDDLGERVGFFRVTVTVRYRHRPYRVLRIVSRGFLGDSKQPLAVASKTAEVDMDPARQPFRLTFVTSNEP